MDTGSHTEECTLMRKLQRSEKCHNQPLPPSYTRKSTKIEKQALTNNPLLPPSTPREVPQLARLNMQSKFPAGIDKGLAAKPARPPGTLALASTGMRIRRVRDALALAIVLRIRILFLKYCLL